MSTNLNKQYHHTKNGLFAFSDIHETLKIALSGELWNYDNFEFYEIEPHFSSQKTRFDLAVSTLYAFKRVLNGDIRNNDFKLNVINYRIDAPKASITIRLEPSESSIDFVIDHLSEHIENSIDESIEHAREKIQKYWNKLCDEILKTNINDDIDELINIMQNSAKLNNLVIKKYN